MTSFLSHVQILTWLFITVKIFFNSCQMVYLHHDNISVFTHDFQHTTKNCPTHSSLRRAENYVQEPKHYRVFQVSLERKYCYSPFAKRCSTSIWHFISTIIIFYFYSMIFNTIFSWIEFDSSLLCVVKSHVLKLKFYFDTN